MAGRRTMVLGVCAVLIMAMAAADAAASGELEPASVVVGLARCADCARKNMKAEAAFKGLQVAIKCKNGNGEYESKAVGELQSSGAFSVPLAADLHGADCHAQLHSVAGVPCPGQEPSKIVPTAEGRTFVAVAGKAHHPSAECASAFLCDPFHKKTHFFDHFHKTKPVPEYHSHPVPEYKPTPEYHPPTPVYHSPTPVYGQPTPIYHPPVQH